MKVDNISFQAHVPPALKDRLLRDAPDMGAKAARGKLAKIEEWGCDTSTITTVQTKNKKGIKTEVLALVNSYSAPFRHSILPIKDTLLNSFMSLTKKDIQEAERGLLI